MATTLYYIHDPMCSWCWGFKPAWQQLQELLPEDIKVEYILGGLAPDSVTPMPTEMKNMLEQTWRRIETQLGTTFNYDFWTQCQPVRTTYSACRAVIAAQFQDQGKAMVSAIQEAYYLRAMEPHLATTHALLAQELGLKLDVFQTDLSSQRVEIEFQRQLSFCQMLGVHSFPSLVLESNSRYYSIPISYDSVESSLLEIKKHI
ncbi:DsbA family protein [Vibrio hibernica]|uniref:DsbA family protein n=1 Tax=Vibrio hibernica TaxID=2587465 RepID=UPI00187EFAC4|nr:DsbA family protein [Vibrio hibernica]